MYYININKNKIKKHVFSSITNRLMDFFPAKKQTEEYLRSVFIERDLAEVVKLHKAQASYEAKRELQQVWYFPIFFIYIAHKEESIVFPIAFGSLKINSMCEFKLWSLLLTLFPKKKKLINRILMSMKAFTFN